MQEANRPRVQGPTQTLEVVATQSVLVPAVLDRLHVAGEHEQEGRERAELVDPPLPLHLHPPLDLARVPARSPHPQVHDHDPRVEVARRSRPVIEDRGEAGPVPEGIGEVLGEVGMAILGGGDRVPVEGCLP